MKKKLSHIITVSQIKKHRAYIVLFFLTLFNYNSFAQIVNIPDPAFKSELVSNAAINTNGDGEIQVSEAVAYTGTIMTFNASITDLTGLDAFINLDTLHLQNVNVSNTALNLTANSHLKSLDCISFPLTSIDLSNNHELVYLWIQSTNITGLDLSQNNSLTNALISGFPLTSIDVTNDSLLSYFVVGGSLTSIDVSTLRSLTDFQLPFNQITKLDVSHNTLLWRLECENNSLTTLDLSSNHALIALNCSNNPNLTSLNVQNGHNISLSWANLDATVCPNLTCVQVDSVAYAVANWGNSFDPGVNFSTSCPAFLCNVNIPDAAFKAELLSNPLINTNGDNEIQCSEAVAFTGQIQLLNPTITDLTGLEAFINIDTLNMDGVYNLTNHNLDLTANSALRCLYVSNCFLTSLNVSTCQSLDLLFAQTNNLSSIDLSHNHLLTRVYVNNNPTLSAINLTGDTLIAGLHLGNDQLATIDLSTLHSLETFEIQNNPISNLDFTHNPALTDVYCFSTNLTTLDFSHNPLLGTLQLQNNSLLTSLNLQRGFVANIFLQGTNCPNLTCVQVDDVAFATTFWSTDFDPGINFTTSCPAFICNVNIPDSTFKSMLLSNPLINTNGDNEIQCSEAINYTGELTATNPAITDLTGLEAFTNIDSLNLNGLYYLTNQNLDLSANISLKHIYIPNCAFTGLNVTSCHLLNYLFADLNNLSSLDLSHNNLLSIVNVALNPTLSTINLAGDTLLTALYINNNQLTAVDVSAFHNLQIFEIGYNPVTNLDLTHNTGLTSLSCLYTNLTTLDLSHNHLLVTLYCQNDSMLTSLNLQNGNNTNISTFDLNGTSCPNLTCVQVDSVAYSVANWSALFDPGVNFSTTCYTSVGIDANKNNSMVRIYPNPTTDQLNLQISNSSYKEVLLELFDATGQKIRSEAHKINAADFNISTSVQKFNAGIYLLRLTADHQLMYSSRVVKE